MLKQIMKIQNVQLRRSCIRGFALLALMAAGLLLPQTSIAQPVNDDWDSSIGLGSTFPLTETGTNIDATTQAGEQNLTNTEATVWWFFTAPDDGVVTIDTFGSDFATVLDIYTGFELGFENLIPIANNDQAGGTVQSRISFSVNAGQFYEIRVGGFSGSQGGITLNGTFDTSPSNDDFAASINLGDFPFDVGGFNINATTQPSEQLLDDTDATVWWFFQAPEDGYVRIQTFGSNFDTDLDIFTGFELGFENLIPVASSDIISSLETVLLRVNAGEFYEIRVGGSGGEEGSIELSGAFSTTPFNDDFFGQFLPLPFTVSGSANIDATTETGETDLAITDNTVWWYVIPPSNGTVTIDTFGSDFDTVLHAYAIASCGVDIEDAVLITENDQADGTNQSQITFSVIGGECYDFRVGGYFGDVGNIVINGSFIPGLLIGDVNGDGIISLLDVGPFVDLVTNGGYQAEADTNMDGVVDLLDVQPFTDLLSAG